MQLVPVEQIPTVDQIKTVLFQEMDHFTLLYGQFLRMKELSQSENGMGLSAVQVGIPLQFFVARSAFAVVGSEHQWRFFLNCSYFGDDPKATSLEGCLSFPGKFEVRRYEAVRIEGFELIESRCENLFDLKIVPIEEMFAGLDGFVMQHEIDHQNGILISDIGLELEVW